MRAKSIGLFLYWNRKPDPLSPHRITPFESRKAGQPAGCPAFLRNSLREGANPLRRGLRRATSPKGTPFGTADLHAKHTLKVELEGAGILEAVGSANPCSEERYDTPESETFGGCCMAVIRAGEAAGEIHLTVTADDSVQKQLTILIQEAEC